MGHKLGFDIFMFIVFSWSLGVLLSPIQNLQCSDLCPQLVTTFYTRQTYFLFAFIGVLFMAILVLALFMMIRANEDANATQFLIGFMFAFKFDNWFIGGCSVAKTVIPITYMLLTLVYKFTLIMTLSVSILFGLKIDLTLRYPEYALSSASSLSLRLREMVTRMRRGTLRT